MESINSFGNLIFPQSLILLLLGFLARGTLFLILNDTLLVPKFLPAFFPTRLFFFEVGREHFLDLDTERERPRDRERKRPQDRQRERPRDREREVCREAARLRLYVFERVCDL